MRISQIKIAKLIRPLLGLVGLVTITGSALALETGDLDLQGHRGARGLMPENTLPAFAKALSIGVTTLELDVGVSKDGKVVVIHDQNLKPEIARTSDGQWLETTGPAINSLTLEQIKSYDVGRLNPDKKYASRNPKQQPVDGTRIPTLAEVFELVIKSGNKQVKFNIETKINPEKPGLSLPPEAFSQAVLDVVTSYKMADRTTIQSFDWRTLQEVQKRAPDMATAYLTASQRWLDNLQVGKPDSSPWMGGLDIDSYAGSAPKAIKAAGGDVWSAFHKEVTPQAIETAHKLGLLVTVWTVNDPVRMAEMIDMGVDGIITDYPDILRDVMKKRNLAVPAPSQVAY